MRQQPQVLNFFNWTW